MVEAGWLPRLDRQFHWENAGYEDFDAFLASLTARKRKAIRRERRGAVADGIEIEQLAGAAITQAHWDAMFGFYMDTGARKWGRPYLNRDFFSMLGATMADRVLLVLARHGGRYVAGALNLIGDDALYGRYWGTKGHFPFLHFELCYYQAIDFAIAHGLARVEAGAQGEHKLARGYLPSTTYSAHWISHEGLRRAIAEHLDYERAEVDRDNAMLHRYGPFRTR
jgi:predicted N-acyltransferase